MQESRSEQTVWSRVRSTLTRPKEVTYGPRMRLPPAAPLRDLFGVSQRLPMLASMSSPYMIELFKASGKSVGSFSQHKNGGLMKRFDVWGAQSRLHHWAVSVLDAFTQKWCARGVLSSLACGGAGHKAGQKRKPPYASSYATRQGFQERRLSIGRSPLTPTEILQGSAFYPSMPQAFSLLL